jgi:hypothetical protein
MQDALDDACRFGAGKSELAVHDIGKVGARQSPADARLFAQPGYTKIRHIHLPTLKRPPPAAE